MPEINALEPEVERLCDDHLVRQDRRFPAAGRPGPVRRQERRAARRARRRPAPRPPPGGVRHRARGRSAGARPAPLRRAAHGRRGAAPRLGGGDEDRRGQDPRVHAAGVSQRARRAGRAPHHRQRLPRQARRGLDGSAPSLPRAVGRSDRSRRLDARGEARAVRLRHHLRHQQRVRVRLPPRQHGHPASRTRCSAGFETSRGRRTTTRSSTRSTRS